MIVYQPQTFISYEIHMGTFENVTGWPTYYSVMVPYWVPDTGVTVPQFYEDNNAQNKTNPKTLRKNDQEGTLRNS